MSRSREVYVEARERTALAAGDVVRIACEMLGLTQAALARKAGMHAPHLCDIVSGKRKVGRAVAEKLAEALEIPAAHILFAGQAPREGADIEQLYNKMEVALARRNGFLLEALKTLKEAQRQREKELLASMRHAIHSITRAIKANPLEELAPMVQRGVTTRRAGQRGRSAQKK
jgi:transcriptional regulator with XRE-family HTH domain